MFPYQKKKPLFFLNLCSLFILYSTFLCNFADAIRNGAQDILLNNLTIATCDMSKLLILGLNPKGAVFPYLEVACGEP